MADDGSHQGDRGRGAGKPASDGAPRRRRTTPSREVPRIGDDREHHDQAARRLHLGGHARRTRGGHRGQARRPGASPRRERRVEGPHRERQLHGQQLDGAGPQHRRGDDRGRQWRSVEEDHGGRAWRDPAAQGSHQHDGRSASLLCLRGDARRPRGGNRRQARRPGDGSGRRRHLEGSHQLGERHVRQPHRSGAQHRPCDDRGRARRPVAQDHGRCARRDPGAEGYDQHHGRSAQRLRVRGHARRPRGRHRRQARRPGDRSGRRRHLEGPHRQRQFHGRQPDGPGPQYRGGRDRHRGWRPFEEDHGQCERRDSPAQGDPQHDGRSAQRLRGRGDARGA